MAVADAGIEDLRGYLETEQDAGLLRFVTCGSVGWSPGWCSSTRR